MVIVLLYQSTLSLPTVFPTPDNADSTANGTRILPCIVAGIVACWSLGKIAYCHNPLRFVQLLLRINCGRGYSGKTLAGLTLSAQGEVILSPTFCHAFDCAITSAQVKKLK